MAARRARGTRSRPPRRDALHEAERRPTRSATAVAVEALMTGVLPSHAKPREEIPNERETICAGDPDDRTLANEYSGEETPGGSTPTPDQNGVDAIGRAYGLQEEDSGALRSSFEVLGRRDRHRAELAAPRKPGGL